MKSLKKYLLVSLALSFFSCASSITALKTGKGFHEPTDAGRIDILTSVPKEKYEELGVVSASRFNLDEIGKMHNAIRDKASTFGADAVIITNQGVVQRGVFTERWAEGTAIKWTKQNEEGTP